MNYLKTVSMIACLLPTVFFAGCLATSDEISGVRDDLHELQLKLNELQRNQADLSAKMDEVSSAMGPLGPQLQETQNSMSLLNQRLDDVESGISQKMGKLTEQISGTSLSAAPPPSDLYRLAYSDFSSGKYDVAITGFRSYIQKNPHGQLAPQAQYYLGECFYSRNEWLKAEKEFAQVEETYPRSDSVPAARLKRGLCIELLKRGKEARAIFRSIVKDFPDSPETYTAQEKLTSHQTDGK